MTVTEFQNAIIDAVELARSSKIAAGTHSHDYGVGYAEAKRDVLIELALIFERAEKEGIE